jgi:bacillithiol system protein YtxJ
MDWETLDSKETFQAALTASYEQLVVVFKHSTRCSISRMALKLTTSQWDLPATVRPLLLDLLAHRDVSLDISETLNIHHESPQMLVIRDGKCIHHANHHHIDPTAVKAYL